MKTIAIEPLNKKEFSTLKKILNALHIKYESIEYQSIEEYNEELSQAEKRINTGEFYTQQQMKERFALWKK
jgi:hypothetical protein